mgnify:CR=1 FL=1
MSLITFEFSLLDRFGAVFCFVQHFYNIGSEGLTQNRRSPLQLFLFNVGIDVTRRGDRRVSELRLG